MNELNRQELEGEGRLSGRKRRKFGLARQEKANDEIFEICVNLAVMAIIAATRIAGIWIKEKRLNKSVN